MMFLGYFLAVILLVAFIALGISKRNYESGTDYNGELDRDWETSLIYYKA